MKPITKVISPKNMPTRLPIMATIVWWLLWDRLNMTGVWLGVVWTIWGVYCLLAITVWVMEMIGVIKRVDIFESQEKRIEDAVQKAAEDAARSMFRR